MGGFIPTCHAQTFVEVDKLELYMSFLMNQVELNKLATQEQQQSNICPLLEKAPQGLTLIEQKIAYFEKRLSYKCKILTPEQQDVFDAKWQASSRLKNWIG